MKGGKEENGSESSGVITRKIIRPGKAGEESPFAEVKEKFDVSDRVEKEEEIIEPSFDKYGHPVSPESSKRCHHCGELICEQCSIDFQGKEHCEECLRSSHHDLSRKDYKILRCIRFGAEEVEKIGEITGLSKDEVEERLEEDLREYVGKERKFLFFKKLSLTSRGREALSLYSKIYGLTSLHRGAKYDKPEETREIGRGRQSA